MDLKEKITDNFNVKDFFNLISGNYYRKRIFDEISWATSKFFGMNYSDFIAEISIDLDSFNKNAIEFFFFLSRVVKLYKEKFFYFRNEVMVDPKFSIFENLLSNYLKHSEYSVVEIKHEELEIVLKLVEKEIGVVLKEIDEPKLSELVYIALNTRDYKECEKNLFAIQKPIYKDIRILDRAAEISPVLNINNIKRRLEVFVRHDKETKDAELRSYYDDLDKNEKLNELKMLVRVLIVVVIPLINKK